MGNLGYRTLQNLSTEREPHFWYRGQPVRTWVYLRWNELTSLAWPSSTHHLPHLYFCPTPPAPFAIIPWDFVPSLFPFCTDLSFDFRQEAIFLSHDCYAQSVPWSSCIWQEDEQGWCALWSCSFLSYSAATLLLAALTDDYNYSYLNYSV